MNRDNDAVDIDKMNNGVKNDVEGEVVVSEFPVALGVATNRRENTEILKGGTFLITYLPFT